MLTPNLAIEVPPRSMGYEQAKASIESSFKQTGLDYIDLYDFTLSQALSLLTDR